MISAQRRTQLLAPLSVLVLFASGCSKKNDVDQSQRNSYLIDSDTSGILPGPDGLQLQLTVGSVATPVTIEMNEAEPGDYMPVPTELAGKVYGFEPHNMTFKHPVLIQLPMPANGGGGVITSEPGGPWTMVPSAPAGLFMQVQTDHFSFYAVTGGLKPPNTNPGGGDPDGGVVGPGRDSGSGLGTGTGGGTECADPGTQPSGTTNASGSLAHELAPPSGVAFAAKDGYAVYRQSSMTGGLSTTYQTQLSLTFTDYANACFTAMATGQNGMEPRGGKAGSKVLIVNLEWMSMAGQVDVMPGTYDPNTKDVSFQGEFAGLDTMCQPEMAHLQPGMATTLEITAIDDSHVAGTIHLTGGGSLQSQMDSFNGTFDLPICNLPERPTGMCCLP